MSEPIRPANMPRQSVYVGNGRVLTQSRLFELIYLVESADRLIVPRFIADGIFEADVTSFFLGNVRPDSICLDIGANFGYYTCLLARLAYDGKTTGVEADPVVFELLRDNIAINWLAGCATPLNLAASQADGELTLYRRDRRSGNTSIINIADVSHYGESPSIPFTIRAVGLETLAPGRLDFLKVDVEGAEPLVFRGARQLLERNPGLQIVMEWSPAQIKAAGFSPATFTDDLAALGLSAARLKSDGLSDPLSWSDVCALDYCNLLLRR